MTPERKIPDWARGDRERDQEWIAENLHVFWPTAKAAFEEQGRGAIVVETTLQIPGGGNPFAYFPQDFFEYGDDEDAKRMLREYNPEREFVVMLLKAEKRPSIYRVEPRQKSR